ncbi:type VI secretion system ATPase TssH [Vibrio alginolyticus]|uniref:type VI secretion system ATPase TssH n=2 Tax=Vibrio harveyi group TaxID=717610 RepID=UPI001BD39141|nr:type VI secretion system ATPase TssH [Vibrio alginolyticus]MBT0023395.1 type VI secretion system ATPase TssH [Vibrio alginolyticus]
MASLSLSALVERLSPQAKETLEQAAAMASSRTHHSIEMSHWLMMIIRHPDNIYSEVFDEFDVDKIKVETDIQKALEKYKTGCQSVPGLSAHTVTVMQNALLSATIEFNQEQLGGIHLLFAYLSDDTLVNMAGSISPELNKIEPSRLLNFKESNAPQSRSNDLAQSNANSALNQFTTDLTEQAREGKIDPVIGRDNEIRLMIDILLRRRQNNPILTGEAGVGKTAVVEGLAQKIIDGDVPPALQNVAIKSLDLALLQAGAGMKGEFENRLKNLVKEVNDAPQPIILFIDEAHGLIGGGGQAGQGDAANILKPALARGELRTIAATTWAEYKKYFEKDAALTRRFQVVKVDEPAPELAIEMLRGLLDVMAQHHDVHITNQALNAAVQLSARYINGRQLPDKAVSVLDTACSRVALSQSSTPGGLDAKRNKLKAKQAEYEHLSQENRLGASLDVQLQSVRKEIDALSNDIIELEVLWEKEKEWVSEAKSLRTQIIQEGSETARDKLQELENNLSANSQPLVFSHVNEALIAEVISDWTGIPLGKLQDDEIQAVLGLKESLCKRVVGQDHALELMSEVIKTASAQLTDETRPNGVFLLTGPSGVGKTESALAIAEKVYGSEENVTTINMSEFKEEHKVSLLLGSPPGYVGYGEGGVLTEAVRRKPYSVILLDEMEKAHPGVQDIFYQVFDKGSIKDGEGRDIDFKNTIIIMTANTGTETTMSLYSDPDLAPEPSALKDALRDDLLVDFKPAFLGRVNVLPYLPLSRKVLIEITKLKLDKITTRIRKHYNADLFFDEELINDIVDNSNESGSGARVVQTTIENTLLPKISHEILHAILNDKTFDEIIVKGTTSGLDVSIV